MKEWWVVRQACGGELSWDDLDTVRTEESFETQRESFDEEEGTYQCWLGNEENRAVVRVTAYRAEADVPIRVPLYGLAYAPLALLPGELPGVEGRHHRVYLMPTCPGAREDSAGDRSRLLVETQVDSIESDAERAATLRLAVRMANMVAEKFECGGEPLTVPSQDELPDPGTYVARAETKGTACDALATARVPAEGREGTVRMAIAEGGVIGRCTLFAPDEGGQGAAAGNDHRGVGEALVELTTWRGHLAGALGVQQSPLRLLTGHDDPGEPYLGHSQAWAVADCDGETTAYAAGWGESYFPELEEEESEGRKRLSEAEEQNARELLREYVTAFAQDQVRREGCTDLRLPEEPGSGDPGPEEPRAGEPVKSAAGFLRAEP
ncbi:hypothetical protein JJV70_10085 [Streptomyces sp. JJ66]|uniref:hypothetical protein n=1 Tax=Streptomyces sp. JJ66 TaxID=2803843 RepID=UPI001C559DA2|nr:hypothetical protein [Streptomyces sp. JJ66]MBW1602452.1 hypothetical protein [Streptomyces sp. JJ66]